MFTSRRVILEAQLFLWGSIMVLLTFLRRKKPRLFFLSLLLLEHLI
jgi:uncharacterized membrane protein